MVKKNIVNTPLYFVLIIFCCILWGSAVVGAKIGFQYYPPIMLSGLRFSLAGLLLLPILIAGKQPFFTLFRHWRYMLLFGFVQTFLQYGLFFLGLSKVPGAVAAIIVGSGPVFITILAHFTISDDKFTTRKVISCIMGFSGIIFIAIAGEGVDVASTSFYYGVGLLISCNIIGASTNIIVKKQQHLNVSPIALTSFANFSGGVMLIITSLIFEPITTVAPPVEFYFILLWLAIIPAAGFSIWYYLIGQNGVKVSELNIWKFIIPIIAAATSWIFLKGEQPRWQEIVGVLIIATAIIALQYTPKRKKISK